MKSNKKISHILIAGIKEAYRNEGSDFYHETLKVSHSKFIGIFVIIFLSLNAIFGSLYLGVSLSGISKTIRLNSGQRDP
jgi:inward rectifier potassium channel